MIARQAHLHDFGRGRGLGPARGRICDQSGCRNAGEFRAPRSRSPLDLHYWFCLDHVRAYNTAWDFYRGMGPDEIEASRRADVIGGRPTWPMGPRGPGRGRPRVRREDIEEAFRRFFAFTPEAAAAASRRAEPPRRPRTPEEKALAVLDLASGSTLDDVKTRWKALVKQTHPDANGGDKAAEERLKLINQAYGVLRSLVAKPAAD